MNIEAVTVVGVMAASFSMLSVIPQFIKTYRTKSAGDLSIYMWWVFAFGQYSWVAYGLLQNDMVLVLTNTFTSIVATGTLILVYRYR